MACIDNEGIKIEQHSERYTVYFCLSPHFKVRGRDIC